MSDNPCSHTLPMELDYRILEEAWSLPLSRIERCDLLIALPSVCRAFHAIAVRMFLRDAHVVSPTYATHFLSILQSAAHESSTLSPHTTCHSITFHIYNPSLPSSSSGVFQLYGSSNPTTRAMETILGALDKHDALAPALHCVALQYTGWSFTRELEHTRLLNLPLRVRSLELRFSTPSLFTQHLRQTYLRHHALPMPGVRNLRIHGACPAFVVDVARACPTLEKLETDDVRGVLILQPSLRPFVLLSADDAAHLKQLECLGRKSLPDEQVSAFAGAPEDIRTKPGLPYGFLRKRNHTRI
ncbi:hypothetical protein EI94DRAFT_1564886 [Lactarius quietus]|nr:hypothetical protein EI94DRAFT_1564886 [Lactarius quietus]